MSSAASSCASARVRPTRAGLWPPPRAARRGARVPRHAADVDHGPAPLARSAGRCRLAQLKAPSTLIAWSARQSLVWQVGDATSCGRRVVHEDVEPPEALRDRRRSSRSTSASSRHVGREVQGVAAARVDLVHHGLPIFCAWRAFTTTARPRRRARARSRARCCGLRRSPARHGLPVLPLFVISSGSEGFQVDGAVTARFSPGPATAPRARRSSRRGRSWPGTSLRAPRGRAARWLPRAGAAGAPRPRAVCECRAHMARVGVGIGFRGIDAVAKPSPPVRAASARGGEVVGERLEAGGAVQHAVRDAPGDRELGRIGVGRQTLGVERLPEAMHDAFRGVAFDLHDEAGSTRPPRAVARSRCKDGSWCRRRRA